MPAILDVFPEQIECDTLVFRAIRNGWIVDNQITSAAFILRRFPDGTLETGLSVGNNYQNGIGTLTKIKIVVSLHVGRIRTLDLDVFPDDETHAEVRELPPPEEIILAERAATALLVQCRIAAPVN